MDDRNKRINFRYRCKIHEVHYEIQLYNLEQEKIKIMINTKNSYSDEYVEYSNIYTLIQFQEITNYYILFQSIEEIFEDLIRTIQEKNFSIAHNGSTMTFKIKVMINKNAKDVNFILDKSKTIDLSSQKEGQYFNTLSTKNSEINKFKNNYLEKSKRNVAVTDINELNTLLSDFKDRIEVLEQSQNSQANKKEELPSEKYMNNIMTTANSYPFNANDKITQGLENILSRLQKLEIDNQNKDKKIEKLEKKLRYYESIDNQEKYDNNINSINNIDSNNNYINTVNNKSPKYPIRNFTKMINTNKIGLNNIYNKNNEYNPFSARNTNLNLKPSMTLTPNRLRQTKTTESFNPKFNNKTKLRNKSTLNYNNNNDSASFHSKETQRYNNDYNNNNNYNDQFSDQQTNPMNNDLKTNSTLSNYSNANDRNFQKYIQYKEKLRIPIVPRENLKKFVNSRIIFTKNELRLLKTKFTQGAKNIHAFFDLLYRASTDGDYEEIAKSIVRNKEKTLTLFYTYEGARFGVYTWRKPAASFLKGKIYKEIPGTSFMVSLNNLKFFDIREDKTSKGSEDLYLCFGRTFYLNTNGTNWIINTPRDKFLKKKCIIGDKGGDYINLDTELLVGMREEYHIKEVEIFEVAIEKDDQSSEEYKNKKNKKKKK